MTRRQGILLLLTGAAAFVAALCLRPAALPGERHDPRHGRAFDRAAEQLPLLAAAHVRSEDPEAALLLDRARGPYLGRVSSPAGVAAEFRTFRYLYASPEAVRDARAAVERGELPAPLPPLPDLRSFFRIGGEEISFDVEVRDQRGIARIRETLPDAALSGEPVRREAERREAETLMRPLVLGLVAAALFLMLRKGLEAAIVGLLRAVVALAALGLSGLGFDGLTLPALLFLALSTNRKLLLLGWPAIFSPAPTLQRLGLVLLLGYVMQWGGGWWPRRAVPVAPRLLVAVLALSASAALLLWPAEFPPTEEYSLLLVAPSQREDEAARLRAAGCEVIFEEGDLLPPVPDAERRRDIVKIFERATFLARGAEPGLRETWLEVAEAASKTDPFLPTALRSRLRAASGRAALWVRGGGWREGVRDGVRDGARDGARDGVSGVAYRRWGEAELSHDARIAALLLLVLLLYLLVARDAPHCIATMLLRSAGIAIGATLVLYFGVSDCYLPLVALAAVSGGIGLPLALLAAAVVAPSLYLLPTVALAAPVLAGLVAERISPR